MAKASDNVFPRVIQGMNTTDQAAPSDSSWRVYAKANGIFARSSNSIVGPFSTGAGGGVATDTIWDTKGDIAAATGADTAAKLAAGANGLVLTTASGQTTGLIWAVPTIPQLNADSSADVTLTADTIADATSVTVSLATGTWLVIGEMTFSATTAARDYCLVDITDASNNVVGEARGDVSSGSPVAYTCFAVVSPGTTTSYKLRGQSGRTGNKILRYGQSTNIGTRMVAIRVL